MTAKANLTRRKKTPANPQRVLKLDHHKPLADVPTAAFAWRPARYLVG